MSDLLKAIILGIVEGVTEFLPISSTGHLVICEKWLGIDLEADPFWKMFAIFIQIGAIAAVVVYFWNRIVDLLRSDRSVAPTPLEVSTRSHNNPTREATTIAAAVLDAPARSASSAAQRHHALTMVAIGSLPLVIAYFAHKWAEQNLESAKMIAAALGIGGLLMILIEWFRPPMRTPRIEGMNWRQALGIGMAQIIAAIFPGTSRSAATIMGGELAGLSRPAAAEFSFFLAIPAMSAACTFSLLNHRAPLEGRHYFLLAVGTIVSFIVAWAVIAAFMSFIRRHSFIPFAIYRIGLSIVVLSIFR